MTSPGRADPSSRTLPCRTRARGGIRPPSTCGNRRSVPRSGACWACDAMGDSPDPNSLQARARNALEALAGVGDSLGSSKALVQELRNAREYELMGRLAEAVSRRDPDDAKNRRLYAQCLIDTGRVTVAVD